MPPITPVVRNLLILNVLIFFGSRAAEAYVFQNFALHDIRSEFFQAHQILTHMFLHGSFMHLFSNMLSLFFFGPMLEHYWGGKRFTIFYLVTGIGASLLYSVVRYVEIGQIQEMVVAFMQNPDPVDLRKILDNLLGNTYDVNYVLQLKNNPDNAAIIADAKETVQLQFERMLNGPMLGASGAVFGILMAFGMLFPNTELMLLFFPVPIKAKYFVFLYGAYELYAGVQRAPGDNVAHFAHLGGMLFAFIMLKLWQRNRTDFY
ncbi:rhomboid family intramembrane serine protease [Nibribacter ruber]|uniref:Rhomboid family intramembrane serine protease n=1 Tax=Nibribacter ruber TaxID=2698458 RepID=A0A6P1NZB0_9BACT|nr:rhomboid family intramembrane serine protease [Nibribacter ruber]QHL87221.1 rhomboid family intramembrane serine protease [Nibribacter ruber]